MSSQQILKTTSAVAMLAGTIALLFPNTARAQTAFTFNTGYDLGSPNAGLLPTLNANGTTSSGEVNYGISLNQGVSATSSIYVKGGDDIRHNTTSSDGPLRAVAGGFVLPKGLTATLSTISFDVYVKGGPTDAATISTLFTGGYYGIFAGNPNTVSNQTPVDGSFSTALPASAITTTYEGVRLAPNNTTDTSRTLYRVTLNVSSTFTTPLSSSMNVSDPGFFLGVSLDQRTSDPVGNDVNIAFATATDSTSGQPKGTNGDAVVYSSFFANGYQTDNPNSQSAADQQTNPIFNAFALQLTGFISGSVLPEPNALLFALSGVPVAGVAFARRRRKAQAV